MPTDPFAHDRYTIRRKLLKLFGAGFYVLDVRGDVVAYSEQRAFRLKEDIRVFAGEAQSEPLLRIRARQVIDFAACYDVVDERDGRVVGAARRRGLSSIVRDSWELLDAEGGLVARLQEDSLGMALLRRLLVNLVPQRFTLGEGPGAVQLTQRFNPFVYKLEVAIPSSSTIDRRLVLALAILIAAIEGRQD
ncbi:hypothetical protein [Engelhardtia mirabilis]|uniref:Scramblase n=1 Tax=Engelhardtia mirabilis TaxID=2528011 RepID=A0A518BDX0_9BACT|nr:hypothetical protein Pla133_02490 [Planctomycetes bacterium Pla133]QDU99511.1 hypothetical protein Pla86_02490 [Planctomycetes bacterium Pla86]